MKKFLIFLSVLAIPVLSFGQNGEGCLEAINGQYPSATYIPQCAGIPEYIVTTAWASEYSKVELTEGITYTFSSSRTTDYITISDANGQTALIYGYTPLTYSSSENQVVRFYTHADEDCGADQEDRARIVQCGEAQVEPEYRCEQLYNFGTIAYASSVEPSYGMTANDFFVPIDVIDFELDTVSVLMFAMAGSSTDFTTFDVKILSDNNGTPGEEIYSAQNLSMTYQQSPDLYMGYLTYWVTLDLDSVSLDSSPDEDTRYWMVFQAHSLNDFDMQWVLYPYTEGWNTQPTYTSANGQNWAKVTQFGNGDHYDGFMSIEADCSIMSINDLDKLKFEYFPNPVTETLNIVSNQKIKEISVYNLAGQSLMKLSENINGKVNLAKLVPGTYILKAVLENGQVETFKVMKK